MTEHPTLQPLARIIAQESETIVHAWLKRVADRVTVDEQFLFPSEDLLDHVPLLVEGIARAVAETGPITVDTPVVLKARELGRLRFEQGFSAHQILWEYQLLGAVLLNRLEEIDGYPQGRAGQIASRRLFDAISAVQRATMEEFLGQYERAIHEREERLRGFNHALSHELRTEIGAILGGARMLREEFVVRSPAQRDKFVQMVIENAERVEHLVGNLLELSRLDGDTRRNRNVLLGHAAEEAVRSLRDFAEARGVEVRIDEDLPQLEVNAAAVELALVNLIANGIKYHDPSREDRWVRVRGTVDEEGGCVVVEVMDNGRGVPPEDRPHLFERFFRSDAAGDVEGTGLGLHLVRSSLRGVGGEAWAEFPASGETVFAFSLPARRGQDPSEPGD